jgi:pantetheine-phosphate adenylyltransferase
MKKIGVFTGSFNPFTKGHLNILQQAENIFDEVIVAIGDNPAKEESKINRLATLRFQLPGKRVEKFSGFLVNYIHDLKKEGDVTIIRGLRNSSDLLYEINTLRVLNDMDTSVKTVFFVCDRKYEHISSTLVRQMEQIQEGSASEYVVKPENLEKN